MLEFTKSFFDCELIFIRLPDVPCPLLIEVKILYFCTFSFGLSSYYFDANLTLPDGVVISLRVGASHSGDILFRCERLFKVLIDLFTFLTLVDCCIGTSGDR
jgi:hypothetical protein